MREEPSNFVAAASLRPSLTDARAWANPAAELPPDGPAQVPPTEPGPTTDSIAKACSEAGWTVHPRSDGTILAEVDPAELGLQAILSAASDGQIRGTVDLLELSLFESETAWQALTQYLLRLNALVRGVRASLVRRDEVDWIVLEAFASEASSSAQLEALLCSLSVACRLAANEGAALADPEISSQYLSIVGGESHVIWSRSAPDPQPTTTQKGNQAP